MADHVLVALSNIIQPVTFLLITGGVALGVLVAALPGVTAPMAIALLIPLTFGLEPYQAISMMAAIYLGGQYGGSITAILIEVQGTSSSSVFEGYPLSQKGQAGKALGVAVTSSALGGLFGVIILIAFAPALAKAALLFGPAEYFALAIFGLSIVTTISAENLVKEFIAVCLYIPLPQDSGYGGDISVSRQYDTPCDKHHAQITSSPRIYSTPHIAACSFTHGQSPWNSALRVIRCTLLFKYKE